MKATVNESYPHNLLRGKTVSVKDCRISGSKKVTINNREYEDDRLEYKITYREAGMYVCKWLDEAYLDFH